MNRVILSSAKMDWATPGPIFAKYDDKYNFTIDVCASSWNHKVSRYYDEAADGLSKSWAGEVCWCNPPYGRAIAKWVQKAYNESRGGACKVVMLIPARTDTTWFHSYIYGKDDVQVEFLKGRITFEHPDVPNPDASTFPSMIVVFG